MSSEKWTLIKERCEGARYFERGEVVEIPQKRPRAKELGTIAVVSAGTSDGKVAEEAAVVSRFLGARVTRYTDVGVAGLSRLLEVVDDIGKADVVIAIAGMEGALPSVLSGLISSPIISVPTSVGYGVGLGGFVALQSMLASCSPGLVVVNIDNGFGAAVSAMRMLRLKSDSNRELEP